MVKQTEPCFDLMHKQGCIWASCETEADALAAAVQGSPKAHDVYELGVSCNDCIQQPVLPFKCQAGGPHRWLRRMPAGLTVLARQSEAVCMPNGTLTGKSVVSDMHSGHVA